jgi:hypothetical protein
MFAAKLPEQLLEKLPKIGTVLSSLLFFSLAKVTQLNFFKFLQFLQQTLPK